MIYLDTTYLVRLYFDDPGYEVVRQLAATDLVACCAIGHAGVLAAFHRKLREGQLTAADHQTLAQEFSYHSEAGAYRWLPLSEVVLERVQKTYGRLPANVFLRAADAVHLACAAEHRLTEIYSNDTRLLSAAPHFGLKGLNLF